MTGVLFFFLMILAATAALVGRGLVARILVQEFEVALLYRQGRYVRTLQAGLHRVFKPWASWRLMDRRIVLATIPGQQLLTADNVGLKTTLIVAYEIEDPLLAAHKVVNHVEYLYAASQLVVRDLIAAREAEKLLAERAQMNEALLAAVRPAGAVVGVKVHRIEIKDLMFSGELKTIFASVVRARQEGLAALERARSETAAMRNLLNAATLMESHPALLSLKWLQSFAPAGSGSGNTFVVGAPPELLSLKENRR